MVRTSLVFDSGTFGIKVQHGGSSGAAEFLRVQKYHNVQRWANQILDRPAVCRGRMVNRISGEPSNQLHERHDARDFETRTQEKLETAR